MKTLRRKEKQFLHEYVDINFRRYREMVRGIFPSTEPVRKELEVELAKVYEEQEELRLAINYAEQVAMSKLLRRPPISNQ